MYSSAIAEIYKYTDSSGKVHYVDDPSKIPDAYQYQAKDPHELPKIIRDDIKTGNHKSKEKTKEDFEFEKYLAQVTIAPFKHSSESIEVDDSEKTIEFTINQYSFNELTKSAQLTAEEVEFFNKLRIWALPIFIFAIVFTFLQIIAFWILLTKANLPAWGILIPIYNLVLLSRLAGYSGWWTLWVLVPILGGIIWSFSVNYNIAIRNGRSTLFAIGNIFLPFIFTPIMAFSKN